MSYAIVVARFYEHLADRLIGGAQTAFADAGAGEADVFDVPGAFELPLAARYAALTGRYDGVCCLGAVIRGETDHYDWVCAETARGILTVDPLELALERSGGAKRDSGRHAAEDVLALARLREELGAD